MLLFLAKENCDDFARSYELQKRQSITSGQQTVDSEFVRLDQWHLLQKEVDELKKIVLSQRMAIAQLREAQTPNILTAVSLNILH